MKTYQLEDYDYFRFGQQLIAIQSMAAIKDGPFYVEAQDNYRRTWAMGVDAYDEFFVTHDRTNLMFPLALHSDFTIYKTIRSAAQVYDAPQTDSFELKFDNYGDDK